MVGLRSKLTTGVNWLTTVNHPDPNQVRRGKLLNILLSGIGLASILGVAYSVVTLSTQGPNPDSLRVITSGSITTFLIFGLYLLNRFVSPRAAALIFLVGLIVLISFADIPQQVINGRSTILYVLPIIMASVVVSPSMSFVFAGLESLVLALMSYYYANLLTEALSLFTVIEFFLLALVAWLSARSLEQALTEVRTINRELDQRVIDRTHELYDALTREHAEASKNQAILESIADGVIVFDSQGQAIVANPAVGRLLEHSSDEITRYRIERLMDGKVTPTVREQIVGLLRDDEAHHANMRFEWGEKTISASFAPVYADQNTPIGTVAVFRDFTREAEVERMKSDFVSMVSHELRTPLNAVLGYAEILLESVYGSLGDRQRSVVARIMTNTKRLLSLVNDLLDQAQIEVGRLSFNLTSFTPNELAEGAHSLMLGAAQAKSIALTYKVAADMPATLEGDPQRLHQILVNLVNNAIKFTERGSIQVQIYQPDADHWALAVSDTGAGIPPEAQLHIFEPFWQVEETATRSHAGVGLGLSIVKKLVDLMKGEITLSSELGRGSTFIITLPLTPTPLQEALT